LNELHLPTLTCELLEVSPVVLVPEARTTTPSKSTEERQGGESEGESDEMDAFLQQYSTIGGQEQRCFVNSAPPNLGYLGEEWAFQWLKRQNWVVPVCRSYPPLIRTLSKSVLC
jgi:hypothetical protein